MRFLPFGVSILLLLCICGCARIPQREIDLAKTAIEAARVAQADLFSPELFRSACRGFDSAAAVIHAEQVKLPFAASYASAKAGLVAAAAAADESRLSADAGRARQKICADSLVDCAHDMVSVTARALSGTRKVGPAVRDSLRGIADSAATMAAAAQASLREEDFGSASAHAHASIVLIGPAWRLLAPKKDRDSTAVKN